VLVRNSDRKPILPDDVDLPALGEGALEKLALLAGGFDLDAKRLLQKLTQEVPLGLELLPGARAGLVDQPGALLLQALEELLGEIGVAEGVLAIADALVHLGFDLEDRVIEPLDVPIGESELHDLAHQSGVIIERLALLSPLDQLEVGGVLLGAGGDLVE